MIPSTPARYLVPLHRTVKTRFPGILELFFPVVILGITVDPKTEKLKEANISLIINNYNDIFSSFDPRSYLEKALSDDFLQECKRAARDKEEGIELRILVPKKARDVKEEWKIKKKQQQAFQIIF